MRHDDAAGVVKLPQTLDDGRGNELHARQNHRAIVFLADSDAVLVERRAGCVGKDIIRNQVEIDVGLAHARARLPQIVAGAVMPARSVPSFTHWLSVVSRTMAGAT